MNSEKNARGQTLEEFLTAYDPGQYERPSVTVDMAAFTLLPGDPLRLAVLLIKRGDHPFINRWALPGGFINMDEDLSESAYRELLEETGVKDVMLYELGAFGAPDRDPRTRVITFAYFAMAPMGTLLPKAGDDAADARLFAVETLVEQKRGVRRTMLHLKDGSLSLRALLRTQLEFRGRNVGQRMRIVDGGELACDHALILGRALERLRTLPPEQSVLPMLPPVFTRRMYRQACSAVYNVTPLHE
ncbi:MAG: NUDIX domain-containing protein [Bacillota bacterium]